MDLNAARKLADDMMEENDLTGWKFGFDRSQRRFGCCNHIRKRISVSASLVLLNEEAEVRDTLAHEIAHALTPGRGHDVVWKKKARELGASTGRCFDGTVNVPEPPFIGTCPICGKSVKRFRRLNVACGDCCKRYNNGRYSPEFRIVFRRVSA